MLSKEEENYLEGIIETIGTESWESGDYELKSTKWLISKLKEINTINNDLKLKLEQKQKDYENLLESKVRYI